MIQYNLGILLVFILAVFRITHLFVYDHITLFLRKPFVEEIFIEKEGGEGYFELIYKGNRLFQNIGFLLSCPWCMGIWVSVASFLCYILWPHVVLPILYIFAVAGGAAILETWIGKK